MEVHQSAQQQKNDEIPEWTKEPEPEPEEVEVTESHALSLIHI